jgi:hypothetical protein
MSSGAPAAMRPMPGGGRTKRGTAGRKGSQETRGSAGRLRLGHHLSLRLLRKLCEQTWAPQSRRR